MKKKAIMQPDPDTQTQQRLISHTRQPSIAEMQQPSIAEMPQPSIAEMPQPSIAEMQERSRSSRYELDRTFCVGQALPELCGPGSQAETNRGGSGAQEWL